MSTVKKGRRTDTSDAFQPGDTAYKVNIKDDSIQEVKVVGKDKDNPMYYKFKWRDSAGNEQDESICGESTEAEVYLAKTNPTLLTEKT